MRKLIIALLVLTCSCNFVVNKEISGNYHLVAVDTQNDICLAYKLESENYICIVPAEIIAFSKVQDYILLKQIAFGLKDNSDTNFYIIPVLKDNLKVFPEDKIIGPLNRAVFDQEVARMNLGSWDFKTLKDK